MLRASKLCACTMPEGAARLDEQEDTIHVCSNYDRRKAVQGIGG